LGSLLVAREYRKANVGQTLARKFNVEVRSILAIEARRMVG